MDYRLSQQEQFEDLRDISENIADYLSRELFKEQFGAGNDYTVNDILAACYSILIQELKELGITIELPEEELLDDWYTAKRIYCARKIGDGNYLKTLFRQDEELRNKVDMWLDNPEESDCLFRNIAEYLFAKHPDQLETAHLEQFFTIITSSQAFNSHVSSILGDLETEDLQDKMPDLNASLKYIEKITEGRKFFKEAIDSILIGLKEYTINKAYLNKVIREYDLDKISADNLKIYALIDNGEVPEALTRYKIRMLGQHHERSKHHIEYWRLHTDETPTQEDLICLVAHHYEPGASRDEMHKAIDEMLEVGKDVFTPEHLEFIQLCAQNLPWERFRQSAQESAEQLASMLDPVFYV